MLVLVDNIKRTIGQDVVEPSQGASASNGLLLPAHCPRLRPVIVLLA